MSIKQNGGVFGRNPTFNDVTIEGQLTFDGDIDINSDLKVDGNLDVIGSATIENLTLKTSGGVTIGAFNNRANAVSSLVLDPRASGAGITGASNVIQPTDENGDRVNGAINFGSADYQFNDAYLSGNLVIGTSGKGIDFSATAGTGTSELLDDYEEGTWTPTITGSTGGAASFTVSTSSYTKIGNTVRLSCYLSGADVTGLSGNVRLGGFPFPASGYHFCVSGYCNFFGFDESDISVGLYTESGQSFSNFLKGSSTVSITATDATTSSGGTIMFNLTYKTT